MSRLLIAAVLVVTLAGPVSAQPKGRKVAFLVGVGTFRHGLPELNGSPKKDATELGKVLKDGGFETVVMTDADATREKVEKRFKDLLGGDGNPARALGKDDLLLVGFFTHGYTLPTAGGKDAPFLATFDSRRDAPETMVSLNGVIEEGKAFGCTTLFLIDACREITDANRNRGIEGKQSTLSHGMAILFSCGRGQVSHQHEKAGGHGLLTYAVLKTLKGETGLRDEVSWTELVASVEKAFKSDEFQAMIPAGKPQRPFTASGELESTELMKIPALLDTDLRAYYAAMDQGFLKETEHLRAVVPTRLATWRERADKGDPVALVLVGCCYSVGVGVERDDREGVRHFRLAADRGHPAGMAQLGWMYENGRGGLSKDAVEAVKWYRRGAALNNAQAMTNLGFMYESGNGGLAKDLPEAVKWYRRGADGGNLHALNNLGCCYRDALGVGRDDVEAVRWFRRGATAGHLGAMNNLGLMYDEGRGGLAKNDAEAFRWYKKAADGGDALGMSNLGCSYRDGTGVAKDEVEALHWFQKSADAGNAHGLANLGWMYENGRGGLVADVAEAIKWYRRAADAGNPYAREQLKRLAKD